jgi:hypothetical protein
MQSNVTVSAKPRNTIAQWHRPSVWKVARLGVTFVRKRTPTSCPMTPIEYVAARRAFVFVFVLNHTPTEAFKAYAGQKKSRILSSWSKPPGEAPRSPTPLAAIKKRKRKRKEGQGSGAFMASSSGKKKERRAVPLWHPTPAEKREEWCLYGIRLRQKREKSSAFMASYSYRLPTSVTSKKSKIPFVNRSS